MSFKENSVEFSSSRKLAVFYCYAIFFVSVETFIDEKLIIVGGFQSGSEYIETDCSEMNTLTIKGKDIKFSDFVTSDGSLLNLCNDVGVIKQLKVFASKKIIIDVNFYAVGDELKLYVLAPAWYVIDTRKIVLDGSTPIDLPRAQDGYDSEHINGQDGEQGEPGGPAGHFFGSGEEFFNCKDLTITANGGNGGNGQDGGHGLDGINGNADITNLDFCSMYTAFPCKNGKMHAKIYNGEYRTFNCKTINKTRGTPAVSYLSQYPVYEEKTVGKIYSQAIRNGGMGGRGGLKGNHGYAGAVTILNSNKNNTNSGITIQNLDGRDGLNDGKGGRGGRHSSKSKVLVYELTSFKEGYSGESVEIKDKECKITYEFVQISKPGVGSEVNSNDKFKKPKKSITMEPADILSTTAKYKTYAYECLHSLAQNDIALKFIYSMEEDEEFEAIRSLSDCRLFFNFSNDLLEIEKQHHLETNIVDLHPLYQSLLYRIDTFITKSNCTHDLPSKKAMLLLYTATFGRSLITKLIDYSIYIVDINTYKASVISNINSIVKQGFIFKNINTIDSYIGTYENFLKNMADLCNDFINQEVNVKHDKSSTQINKEIDGMIKNVIELQEKDDSFSNELKESKDKLEHAISIEVEMPGVICLPRRIIGTLPVVGKTIVAVIRKTSGVIESLIFGKPSKFAEIPQLTEGIGIIANVLKAELDKEIGSFKWILLSIEEEIKKHINSFKEVSIELTKIKLRLNNVNNFENFQELRNELRDYLNNKVKPKMQSKNRNESCLVEACTNKIAFKQKSQTYEDSVPGVLETITQISKYSPQLVAVFKSLGNDIKRIRVLRSVVKGVQVNFQKYEQCEKNMQHILIELILSVESKLRSIAKELGKTSVSELSDVTKWRVPERLSNLKLQIKLCSKGISIQSNLVRSKFSNLKNALNLLVRLFELIEYYQRLQKLSNYHDDISSSAVTDVYISGYQSKTIAEFIETTIKSNLILQQYKIVLDTLKSQVFPFASAYLESLLSPSKFDLGESTKTLVSKLKTEINHIDSSLESYPFKANQLETFKRYVMSGAFEYEAPNSIEYDENNPYYPDCEDCDTSGEDKDKGVPFFVWRNTFHNAMISKLLSGQAVVVNADIAEYNEEQYAVKFKTIKFELKSKVTSKLQDLLKGFVISATHFGFSFYMYNRKLYVITAHTKTISTCFENNIKGEINCTEDNLKSSKAASYWYSPFSMWNITLIKMKGDVSFQDLMAFKDEIDLELTGEGSFLAPIISRAHNLLVDTHYKSEKANTMVFTS